MQDFLGSVAHCLLSLFYCKTLNIHNSWVSFGFLLVFSNCSLPLLRADVDKSRHQRHKVEIILP